jgi:hypothetical protein
MYTWIDINDPADFEALTDAIALEDYALREVIERLQLHISSAVGGILVEYPYVDKDYRSTYYHYYAKKGGGYSPHCARLHFFKRGYCAKTDPLRFTGPNGAVGIDVDDGYYGFMVLRPTRILTIGRSVISPKAVREVSGYLIDHKHKAHVIGNKVTVRGFPYMQQHSDIAVCAHAACWAILRHYSERYALYSEVLLHNVSKLGKEFDPGGLVPSMGITYLDAERIFAAAGTYPLIVPKAPEPAEAHRFYSQLLAYLDSGFPLFGVLSGRAHAVAIVGYRSEGELQASESVKLAGLWDYVSHLLVVDDNHFPYQAVPRTYTDGYPYGIDEIDAFIVPLPEKMFFPANAVIELANELTNFPNEHFQELENLPGLVIRHFLTTTAAWHRHIRKTVTNLPHDFSKVAFELAMPQFIWVVEYATPAQWKSGAIQARLVLDATAGRHEVFPAFLLHDAKGALWLDRATRAPMVYQTFEEVCDGLIRMDNNLTLY